MRLIFAPRHAVVKEYEGVPVAPPRQDDCIVRPGVLRLGGLVPEIGIPDVVVPLALIPRWGW
jgi:hypothetical protein